MSLDCHIETDNKIFRYRAAAIIIEEGCVLFATNSKVDYLYSIGGGVHIGETSEQAVKREVLEETGIHYDIDINLIQDDMFVGFHIGHLGKSDYSSKEYLLSPHPQLSKSIN